MSRSSVTKLSRELLEVLRANQEGMLLAEMMGTLYVVSAEYYAEAKKDDDEES